MIRLANTALFSCDVFLPSASASTTKRSRVALEHFNECENIGLDHRGSEGEALDNFDIVCCTYLNSRENQVLVNSDTRIRAAMSVGLHRDSKIQPNMPALEAEMRRRL